ncbi:MAG: hypothetical protein ACI3ZT_04800 [Candidatus Cryptobacteroides sp.]
MEQKSINLKTLTMDELAGVVNLYPWFAAARKELCVRMARLGGDSWGTSQFADQAMYLVDRGIIAEIANSGRDTDYSDFNLESLVRSYIEEHKPIEEDKPTGSSASAKRVRAAGGDFFSADEYEKVKRSDDNFIFPLAQKKVSPPDDRAKDLSLEFCTETLAEIYAEQGYFEQAKRIYDKLILAFPEKSAYFASLIEKLDKLINNQTL